MYQITSNNLNGCICFWVKKSKALMKSLCYITRMVPSTFIFRRVQLITLPENFFVHAERGLLVRVS